MGGAPVRVGTENRAKLGAVEAALRLFVGPGVEPRIVGVAASSGVAEQPVGWDEIVRGARNRARAALESGDCVLGVGIEDGLVDLGPTAGSESGESNSEDVYNVGCAWVTDGEREGHGFSSGFAYPPACREPAFRQGLPIGDLFDRLWRARRAPAEGPAEVGPSGRRGGNIGMLTQGRLDRSAYGAQAVVCALVPFLHTDLYD